MEYKINLLGIPVKLEFKFISKIRDITKTISMGIMTIFIAWYYFKNLYKLVRNTEPIGGGDDKKGGSK